MSVYLLATLDTKGQEAAFVRDRLVEAGVDVVLVDTGCVGEPSVRADVPREEVFRAGGTSLEAMRAKGDRGEAVTRAAEGAAALARRWHAEGRVDGILGIGGGAGTTIGTAAMRALPLGVPKLMVSTLASGQVSHYVGSKDVMMMSSVVDVSGVNRVSRLVFTRAAQAMAGMAKGEAPRADAADRPLIAATMFGVTTPCVDRARAVLEAEGFEVLVFHATGAGGRAMESLVRDGVFEGVLDVTTTELADEIAGGFLTAGPERCTAAGEMGIPQVVSVGATDMVNFHGIASVPSRFAGRKLHRHNENVTLMRTTPEECAAVGADLGGKLAAAKGPVHVFLPRRGVSALDREGEPFDDPAARRALFDAFRATARKVAVEERDAHLNDPDFAEAMARKLVELIRARAPRR